MNKKFANKAITAGLTLAMISGGVLSYVPSYAQGNDKPGVTQPAAVTDTPANQGGNQNQGGQPAGKPDKAQDPKTDATPSVSGVLGGLSEDTIMTNIGSRQQAPKFDVNDAKPAPAPAPAPEHKETTGDDESNGSMYQGEDQDEMEARLRLESDKDFYSYGADPAQTVEDQVNAQGKKETTPETPKTVHDVLGTVDGEKAADYKLNKVDLKDLITVPTKHDTDEFPPAPLEPMEKHMDAVTMEKVQDAIAHADPMTVARYRRFDIPDLKDFVTVPKDFGKHDEKKPEQKLDITKLLAGVDADKVADYKLTIPDLKDFVSHDEKKPEQKIDITKLLAQADADKVASYKLSIPDLKEFITVPENFGENAVKPTPEVPEPADASVTPEQAGTASGTAQAAGETPAEQSNGGRLAQTNDVTNAAVAGIGSISGLLTLIAGAFARKH